MKSLLFTAGLVLVTVLPTAQAGSQEDSRPCVSVNVQNDTVNHASVHQDCGRNINRTVQAGEDNAATTVQTGEVNNNKVRQYHYDRARYLNKLRGKR